MPVPAESIESWSEIRFEGVSFAYPGSAGGEPVVVFRDLSLSIRAGESLGIVGDNGAGKTTLVKLLCGLCVPNSGRITVDGVDLRALDMATWRRQLAAVFQDFVRYPLTVRENVTWGAAGELDDDELNRALIDASAAEVLEGLERGVDTSLGREFEGGVELSGGQWQRLAVARALAGLYQRATILILDEPTANLDVRAEARLFERILTVTSGLTTVLISHRFANVRRADRIVVLDTGKVAEDGSHNELLGARGRYAKMFELQASRFRSSQAAVEASRDAGSEAP
jgi:ATP-binding cassette subfamily B protein